ncbi:phage tail protein [Bacillus sp. C1]
MRVERPKIEQLSTGDQFHLIDTEKFEVIEGKNEPSSIRFVAPDTEMNKRVYSYVEDRNLLSFEGQYYIILVNKQNELGFKDCDAIQVGAELSLQTQEQKITGYLSIDEGLAHTFKGSNFKYINRCSKHNQLHFENFGGESRMKMIRKLLDRFDIECIFDNMTVIFADRIGKTTDKLYKFGYNVNAIEKTTDDSNCAFSVLLLGHTPTEEEDGGPQFQYYYESPLKYKMPELIRYRQAENIEDDKIKNKETALKRCQEVVNDIPIISITVDHKEANFDDTNEPKVGDRAILQHHKYNMDFDVRVVQRRRYPFEQTPNVYEFSNKRDELVDRTNEQKKWTSDILSVVKDLNEKLLEQSNNYTDRINAGTDKKAEEAKKESEAAKKLAELVKENQKNYQTQIIESDIAPTDNLEPGKSLWLDISKGKPGILKKWDGKTWEPIIADVEEAKTELNKKVEDVQKEVNGKYNEVKETVDLVNRTMKDVQNEQGNISKKVATVEQTTDGFNRSIESLKKDNETITNKITTVEETVDGIKENITKVESNQNSFNERITTVEKSADGISQNVSKIQETQTAQGKEITDAKSTIQQHSDALNLAVKIKDVEDYVSGVGLNNELLNTRFNQGMKYWGLDSKFPATIDKNETHWGDPSLTLTVSGLVDNGFHSTTSTKVPVTPNEDVVVSAYFKTKNINEHVNKNLRIAIIFYKSDGSQLSSSNFLNFSLENDTWTRQSYTTKAPADAAKVGLRAYVLRNGTFWMAHPMLQKASKTSAYVENPSDILDKDKILQDIADKVATADYNQKVTELGRQIKANAEGIEIRALKEETYTKKEADGSFAKDAYVKQMEGRIQVTETDILNTVKKGTVISEINQTAESVKIKAGKIELDGDTVASSLKAKQLSGVTIKTADSNRFVELNKQYMTLYDKSVPRSFWGFFNSENSSEVRPVFVLGSDSFKGTDMTGSMVFSNTVTPGSLKTSVGSINMVKNSNLETNTYSTSIGVYFFRENGQLQTRSEGDHWFGSDTGQFFFHKNGADNTNVMSLVRKDTDAELKLSRFIIRGSYNPDWMDSLQFWTRDGSWADLKAARFLNTSQRSLKTYIKDLTFSALEKVMSANVQEYYFKSDVADLYQTRVDDPDNLHTIKEIRKNVGLIADDADEIFTGEKHETVDTYSMVSVTMAGLKEHVLEQREVNNRLFEENKQLKEEVTTLKDRYTELKELVQSLIDKSNQTEPPTTEEPTGPMEQQ